MKREDVQKQIPGITPEQLDWIMTQNGNDINAEKQKLTTLQGQLDAANEQLRTAQEGLKAFEGVDVKDLQSQITKLQGDLRTQAESFAFDALLDGKIRDARGHNVKAIRSLLDLDALRASKNQEADIDAALADCKTANAWGFAAGGTTDTGTPPATNVTINTAAGHGAGGNSNDQDGVMARFMELNPGLKI